MKVAKDVVLVMVDCTNSGDHEDLKQKYQVKGFPAIVFTDPDGNAVGRLGDRSPEGVAKQFADLATAHSRKVPWVESLDDGLKTAKEEDKPVLLYFAEEGEGEGSMAELIGDPALEELRGKFVLVRHVVESRCDFCKRFHVTRAPAVKILDPKAEDPAPKPVYSFAKKKTVKDLEKALETAVKKFEKLREGAPAVADAPEDPDK